MPRSEPIMIRMLSANGALLLMLTVHARADEFDVVVYGGTPAGIASAIGAARLERRVVLVEYHDHIGGMTASGLGRSDIENRAMIGGLFKEFVQRVRAHYAT